ncbi:MAG: uroporphyrinogen decarboxylase family protein [Bryobacteraceae bacterium]|nr:uroporphyrinogen decarboxylase family protein [Bryobacteraceae bacterium]
MMLRRTFLAALAATPAVRGASLTSRERVDRILKGATPDRVPFTLWHHFGLEKEGPEKHAAATIAFHRDYSTDLVKVMSDFPYPAPAGRWHQARVVASPFPQQLKALELIRAAVARTAHFVETLFNPWNVAEKLSSPKEVVALMHEQPQALLNALEAIARSQANHARQAVARGASGVFLAIANAQDGILTLDEYRKFSEPFDRMVLDAVRSAPLNILHLHGDRVYLEHFFHGWPAAAAINYGAAGTGYPLDKARRAYSGVLLGGTDERQYRNRSAEQLRTDLRTAVAGVGPRLIFTPGCSVPDDSTAEELARISRAVIA